MANKSKPLTKTQINAVVAKIRRDFKEMQENKKNGVNVTEKTVYFDALDHINTKVFEHVKDPGVREYLTQLLPKKEWCGWSDLETCDWGGGWMQGNTIVKYFPKIPRKEIIKNSDLLSENIERQTEKFDKMLADFEFELTMSSNESYKEFIATFMEKAKKLLK